jgi:hypothetical protein
VGEQTFARCAAHLPSGRSLTRPAATAEVSSLRLPPPASLGIHVPRIVNLSVVIPAHNEEASVGQTVTAVTAALRR